MDHSLAHAPSPLLLLAIGNDGRQDDGLGWAFAQAMETQQTFPGDIVYRYQLQIEDALLLVDYPTVLFVDACREELPRGFELASLQPAANFAVTTHQLNPATVLALAEQLYGVKPQAYLLKITGVKWELERALSESGHKHLKRAIERFRAVRLLTEG